MACERVDWTELVSHPLWRGCSCSLPEYSLQGGALVNKKGERKKKQPNNLRWCYESSVSVRKKSYLYGRLLYATANLEHKRKPAFKTPRSPGLTPRRSESIVKCAQARRTVSHCVGLALDRLGKRLDTAHNSFTSWSFPLFFSSRRLIFTWGYCALPYCGSGCSSTQPLHAACGSALRLSGWN